MTARACEIFKFVLRGRRRDQLIHSQTVGGRCGGLVVGAKDGWPCQYLPARTDGRTSEVTWRGWDGAAAAGECAAGHTAKERRRRDGSSWLKDDDEE